MQCDRYRVVLSAVIWGCHKAGSAPCLIMHWCAQNALQAL